MRLLALTSIAAPGIGDGTIAFRPGLNVFIADDEVARAAREALAALARGQSPFGATEATGVAVATGGAPEASLDVEMPDGERVRLSGGASRPFRAERLPSGEDRTDAYRSGAFGFAAPLDDRERAQLARLSALLSQGHVESLRHLEDRSRRHRWWHVIDGPQIITCGAVAIAIGAFVWPRSPAAAILAGVVVALATAALIVTLSGRQIAYRYRSALLRLGVRSADELARRQAELEALRRRHALEESWREAWARRVAEAPRLAVVDAEPLVVAPDRREIPCVLVPHARANSALGLEPDQLASDLAGAAQTLVFVKSSDIAGDEQHYGEAYVRMISNRR